MIQKTDFFLSKVVADLTWTVAPATSVLSGLKIGLYKTNVTLTPQTVLADLTESAFGGYAQKSVTFGAPLREANGTWTLLTAAFQWTATDPVGAGEQVFGIFVTDGGAPAKLLWAEAFPSPIPIARAGDGFSYIGKLNLYPPNSAETGTELS